MNAADTYLANMAAAQLSVAASAPGQFTSNAARTSHSALLPWVTPPPGYQAFDTPGSIPLPVIGSGDSAVVQFTVPRGWDGVIKRLSANQTAPGFIQGSGQLIWRVTRNGQAIRGYDNITTELGSVATPRESDGILIYENDLVQLVVNNASLGGGSAFVTGSLAGYFWPKG
jgi:hypothetical protein